MNTDRIGAQVYTTREFMKDRAGYIESLKKIRAIGYTAVQVNRKWPLEDKELVDVMGEIGLTMCSIHDSTNDALDDPEAMAERNSGLPTNQVALPSPGRVDFTDAAQIGSWLKKINRAGEVFKAAGQQLSYHNHGGEFIRQGGRTVLQMLMEDTNPDWVHFCMDAYWVQFGGGNPSEWMAKAKGRLPMIHLKDFRMKSPKECDFAEVGNGNLNFPSIIRTAHQSGCEWYIVEQDICPGDPFDSLRQSFEFLQAMPDPIGAD